MLRAGPPPNRGGLRDLIIGVVGALLLLGTILMAVALPVRDVLPPQFKVSYVDVQDPRSSLNFTFSNTESSRVHDFLYEARSDNVYRIDVTITFKDDKAASDPDRFQVQLYDPGGNQVGIDVPAANVDGTQDPAFPLQYRAESYGAPLTFSPALKPQDAIVQAAPTISAKQLETQLEAKSHIDTKGVWKLRVTLLQAGGCPVPAPGSAPSGEELARATACQQETQATNGKDPGNDFTVGSFTFDSFEPVAEKL